MAAPDPVSGPHRHAFRLAQRLSIERAGEPRKRVSLNAGASLRAATVRAYQKLRPGFAYDAALARRLLGVRELAGLVYGLETDAVDADQVRKIVRVARAYPG